MFHDRVCVEMGWLVDLGFLSLRWSSRLCGDDRGVFCVGAGCMRIRRRKTVSFLFSGRGYACALASGQNTVLITGGVGAIAFAVMRAG